MQDRRKVTDLFAYTPLNRIASVSRGGGVGPDCNRIAVMESENHFQRFRSDPERLARVFSLAIEDGDPLYSQEELGPILRHQLAALIEIDISGLDPGSQRLLRAAAACGEGSGIATFRDLFDHPSPPVSLLRLAKEYGKSHLNHPESPLPPEIASVLYYTSIVVAMVRLGRRLTTLSREDLRDGIQQLLNRTWLDSDIRHLLELGLRRLESEPTPR